MFLVGFSLFDVLNEKLSKKEISGEVVDNTQISAASQSEINLGSDGSKYSGMPIGKVANKVYFIEDHFFNNQFFKNPVIIIQSYVFSVKFARIFNFV